MSSPYDLSTGDKGFPALQERRAGHTRMVDTIGRALEKAVSANDENIILRRLLAIAYTGGLLYGDDGELQDNRELPFIDFKRDGAALIGKKMEQRGIVRLAVQTTAVGIEK